jgi:hypothetical protein
MRSLACLAAAAASAALAAAGCRGHAPGAGGNDSVQSLDAGDPRLSAEEKARRECKVAFAVCAPPARYSAETDVDELAVRNLVQISARLDMPDRLAEAAGKRLRKVAEKGTPQEIQEIARAWEPASQTLERCRCKDPRLRTEFEKQEIAKLVAARLPSAELRDPEYWARRVDEQLGTLRALTRRSAELLAAGDEAGRGTVDAQVQKAEVALCETLHAAHDVLPEEGMEAMRASVYRSRERASGEASVELARQLLDQHEHSAACVPSGRAVVR